MSKWHGGKGSKRRPEDKKKFDDNWDAIFGKKNDDKYNNNVNQNQGNENGQDTTNRGT